MKSQVPLPDGYSYRQTKRGHLMVIRPDGQPLRMKQGIPVVIASTPSDRRAYQNALALIRRAIGGVR